MYAIAYKQYNRSIYSKWQNPTRLQLARARGKRGLPLEKFPALRTQPRPEGRVEAKPAR